MTFRASEPVPQTHETNPKPPELEPAFIPWKKQSISGEPKPRDLLVKRKFRAALLVLGAVAGLVLAVVMGSELDCRRADWSTLERTVATRHGPS